MRTLRGDGTTILLTTHYLDEAQQLADRVGIIAAGRLLALDSPERLGGRESHRARVRWNDGSGVHEEVTQTPTRLVTELAARYGGEVPGLEVVRPSLEDVYLSMIESVAAPGEEAAMTAGARVAAAPRAAGTLRLGRARTGIEVRMFFRQRDSMVFTFAFPVILLFIFGSAFCGEIAPGVSFTQYFAAGMIASGIALSSFQSLAIGIAVERDDGTLKRLKGTPMPPMAYFAREDRARPRDQRRAVRRAARGLAAVLRAEAAGVGRPLAALRAGCSCWGSPPAPRSGSPTRRVPRSSRSAAAVVSPVVIVLQFVSGIFFVYSSLPSWMQHVGARVPAQVDRAGHAVGVPAGQLRGAGGRRLAAAAGGRWCWRPGRWWACCCALRTFRWTRRDAG